MKKKWKRKITVFIFTVLLLFLVFLYALSRAIPIINIKASERSKSYVTQVINESVSEVLSEKTLTYRDLVNVERGEDGSVLLVSANTVEINKLKADVSKSLVKSLKKDMNSHLKIPVGNLSGISVLSGRGPNIPIKLMVSDSVLTFIESDFLSVGINQTWHRILMRVRVRVAVSVLTKTSSVDIEDSVIIGETVIVGKVPDAYTALNKLDEDDIGDIIDFGAQ